MCDAVIPGVSVQIKSAQEVQGLLCTTFTSQLGSKEWVKRKEKRAL